MPDRRAFSVAVFARHQGRILLVSHVRLGKWLPVGGEIEPGETPLEAARRELREETGLDGVFPPDPIGVDGSPAGLIGYEEHQAGAKGLHMNFAFVADVDTDAVVSNGEWADHRWVADASEVPCPANVVQLGRIALHGHGHPNRALARRWLTAFNARDLDGLLALYADDAVHTSPKLRLRHPETHGLVRGKAALRAWWADAFERLPGMHYAEVSLVADDASVFLEYDRTVPDEEILRVAEQFVVRNGQIVASAVFHG